ncbi:molybdate ABC transporter substrate-binding protein [Granulosicoccus antarcticus]|uniref:molybdate ABC transporter substrate-binding protein n=1 Tax=Granulosicoccus antarcticus TaxID=437505 RepID=UPI0012FDED43|nr:molybdate ABC transporter substrate-binding protein [Granulosicoccus antarcticus]
MCTISVPATAESHSEPPLVALASSFRTLWPELMQAYRSETGEIEPRTSFASSGLLTTQIRHGAPFELYLSADQSTVQQLATLGKTHDAGVTLATGAISLVWRTATQTPAQANVGKALPQSGLQVMIGKLEKSEPFKLTIPNPRHAPYGIAAKQALDSAGLWPLPAGYLLSAENAAQTLQFALTGAVDYALVPDTLVMQLPPELQKMPLEPGSYEPVIHQMVLLNPARTGAQTLYEWLQGESAASILSRYGLTPIS